MDHVFGLLCQFECYKIIMLKNNKMVQESYVKSTRGARIALEGKMKGGLWNIKSSITKCQP